MLVFRGVKYQGVVSWMIFLKEPLAMKVKTEVFAGCYFPDATWAFRFFGGCECPSPCDTCVNMECRVFPSQTLLTQPMINLTKPLGIT